MKGYIYMYTFPDGKVYIGQTRRPPEIRHKEHLDPITGPSNRRFWEAYTKYGQCEFKVMREISASNPDELVKELNRLETLYIINNKAYDPAFGYNIRVSGYTDSGAQKIINSKFCKIVSEIVSKRIEPFEVIRQKILEKKGPLTSNEYKLVKRYLIGNNRGQKLPRAVCLKNLAASRLSEFVIFQIEQCFEDLYFDFQQTAEIQASDFIHENYAQVLEEGYNEIAIVQLDNEGTFVAKFYSIAHIEQRLGKSAKTVRNVLNGKQKKALGYKWMYYKDWKDVVDSQCE